MRRPTRASIAVVAVLAGMMLVALAGPGEAQDPTQAENDFAFAEGLYGQENYEL
ncbi:MAG: hypothetical protein GX131_02245, partial [candidate division WS1 bacterium]|nr:hypothetical protein [candidate division WS1 bacterium]